jgi:hypothetical protein
MGHNAELDSDAEGVILEINEGTVSNTGLDLIIKNMSPNDYTFGLPFTIENQINGEWCQLPYIDENFAWPNIGSTLEANSTTETEVDWTLYYGELSPGNYRITKNFSYIQSSGDCDVYSVSAEFTVYWPFYGQTP